MNNSFGIHKTISSGRFANQFYNQISLLWKQGTAREENCICHQSKRTVTYRCRNRNKRDKLFMRQEAELWVLTWRRGWLCLCMSVKNKVWILTLSNLILEAGGTTFAVSLSGQFGTTDRTDSTRTSEYTNWYGIKHFIPAYSLYKRPTRWKTEWFQNACTDVVVPQYLWVFTYQFDNVSRVNEGNNLLFRPRAIRAPLIISSVFHYFYCSY